MRILVVEERSLWCPGALPARRVELVEQLQEYAPADAARVFLQVLDLADLDHLDLIAAQVARQLA